MPADLHTALFVLARLLLGGAFVVFGVRNVANLERLSGVMVKKNVPQPRALIMVGIAIQIVGGLMVATGVLAAWGAAALIAFLILAVYLFHDFWAYSGPERTPHLNAWIMNIGLSGAFLLVIATTP
jgi:putative oxidoreductase